MRLILTLWLVLCALPVWAEKRAFVVGNAGYSDLAPLQNTHADASAYATAFAALGYEVDDHRDLDIDALETRFDAFVARIQPGDEIAVVYAGHGWSDGARNYLIPVDAPAGGSAAKLRRTTFALRNGLDGMLDRLERSGAATIVAIIDACRDNPFDAGTRSFATSRGLARVDAAVNTFVVFSAGAGQQALDRLPDDPPEQRLSVFTRHFAPLLVPGADLKQAVQKARIATYESALAVDGHQQVPAIYDQVLREKMCLGGACGDTDLAGSETVVLEKLVATPTSPGVADEGAIAAYWRGRKLLLDKKTDDAVTEYEFAAEAGFAPAQRALGKLLRRGAGSAKRDCTRAMALLHAASEQGDVEALYELGYIYGHYGRCVEKDTARATDLFRASAEGGHADAMVVMANIYFDRRWVAPDATQSFYWAKEAARHGHLSAIQGLALKYFVGDGVAQDDIQAAHWMRLVVQQDWKFVDDLLKSRDRNDFDFLGDDVALFKALKQADADGDPTAAAQLAFRLMRPMFAKPKVERAADLILKGVRAGDPFVTGVSPAWWSDDVLKNVQARLKAEGLFHGWDGKETLEETRAALRELLPRE